MKNFSVTKKLFLLLLCVIMSLSISFVFTRNNTLAYSEKRISKTVLKDKIKGGWMGALWGNFAGLPTEFKFVESPNPDNSVPWVLGSTFETDDDTSMEYLFLHMMEVYGVDSITYEDMVPEWIYHAQDFIWCGNLHARQLMEQGVKPPYTGKQGYNAEYSALDAQIECEIFGMVSPGMLQNCYDRTVWWLASVGDGEVLQNSAFYAMLCANAYFESDIYKNMATVRSYFDSNTKTAKVYDRALELYNANKTDWRATRQTLYSEFYNGDVLDCTINYAMTIVSLLYGGNDYEKTVQIAILAGFDNDCNAATAGTILGIQEGYSALPQHLKEGSGDTYLNTNRPGLTSTTIDDLVDRIAFQAGEVVKGKGGYYSQGDYVIIDGNFSPKTYIPYNKTIYTGTSNWSYSGFYKFYNNEFSNKFGYGTTQKGASATFTFEGTGVAIVSALTLNGGNVSISIDGESYGSATLKNDEVYVNSRYFPISYKQTIKKITGLKNAQHTVVITTLEEGKYYNFDSAVIEVDEEDYYSTEGLNYARTPMATPICSVPSPTGVGAGGGKINVICDGEYFDYTKHSSKQYDTFLGKDAQGNFIAKGFEDYVGYTFDRSINVTKLIFNEGGHWGNDGGWFANGSLRVEVFKNGVWTNANFGISPIYPNSNSSSVFTNENGGSIYTILVNEQNVNGIRLIGTAGGLGKIVSCGELEVYNVELTQEEYLLSRGLNYARTQIATPICSVPSPTGVGAGGGSINVICDGEYFDSSKHSSKQYDSFLGRDAQGNFIEKDFEDYIGYTFSKQVNVTKLIFNEGGHWNADGGWFANGSMRVEVLKNGVWGNVGYTISPNYPNGNDVSSFPFENGGATYVIAINEQNVSGIRLIGTAGGIGKIISCGELEVYYI